MKRRLVVLLTTLLGIGLLTGSQLVMAQSPDTGPNALMTWGPRSPFVNIPMGQQWHGAGPNHPEAVQTRHQWREIQTIADALNMSTQDLVAALRSGKTVADVAQEQGIDLTTIVDALVAPKVERLNRAVEAGRLTEQQADALLALARVRVEDRLNRPFSLHPFIIAAQVLGMDAPDLWSELQAGKSVAQVADEKGIPLDDIVNAILEPKSGRLNQLVSEGRLTQEQADTLLAMARERVEDMLTRVPRSPQGKGHPGRGRGQCGNQPITP